MNQEKTGIYITSHYTNILARKKKIIEEHIDIDHLIKKGEIVPITVEEIEKN